MSRPSDENQRHLESVCFWSRTYTIRGQPEVEEELETTNHMWTTDGYH